MREESQLFQREAKRRFLPMPFYVPHKTARR
jgi:hypothetical protein